MSQGFVVAQISDSHLFTDKGHLFHGHNVYQNLLCILKAIQSDFLIDVIVFTGDLTQDHSEESYQNFVQAVADAKITKPIYYITGNHDDEKLLASAFTTEPFNDAKTITSEHWTIHLLNSQTQSPAGSISADTLTHLDTYRNEVSNQFIFMHHNPVDVGYFIDKHALINQKEFWETAQGLTSLKGVACGHVHRELTIKAYQSLNTVPLYTCPSTSIQFDPLEDSVSALDERPAYRRFVFFNSGEIQTSVFRI